MPTLVATKQRSYFWIIHFILLCLALPLFTSCESRVTIVNSLDEREANEIIVFLSRSGVEAKKVKSADGGGGGNKEILWDISVSQDQKIEAMSRLSKSGLPRRRGQSLLSIFKDVGLVPSELQEKIRYQAGLAEQLASTIRKIDGVLDAEVQISFPEEDLLNPQNKKGRITASVYVKHSGVLDDPNTQLITKIKRLITASITGLDYDDVTIIPERSLYSDLPIGGFSTLDNDEKEYLNIWTVIVAKEAANRFRTIFFSLLLLILFLILTLTWFGWKVSPLLADHGGIRSLFTLKPIDDGPKKAQDDEEEEEEEESEEDEEEDEEEEEEEDQETKDVT